MMIDFYRMLVGFFKENPFLLFVLASIALYRISSRLELRREQQREMRQLSEASMRRKVYQERYSNGSDNGCDALASSNNNNIQNSTPPEATSASLFNIPTRRPNSSADSRSRNYALNDSSSRITVDLSRVGYCPNGSCSSCG